MTDGFHGLARSFGSNSRPDADLVLDMGLPETGAQLAAAARARRDEIKASFFEGYKWGEAWVAQADAWRHSMALKSLAGRAPGANVIGRPVLCSDPHAAGREVWLLCGIHADAAWLHAGGVFLTVSLSTVRGLVDCKPIHLVKAA
jgi:hypothetical protein